MAKTRTKKNPVAVDEETQEHKEYLKEIRRAAKFQELPLKDYKIFLDLPPEDGRFLFVDRDTYDYVQAETIEEGFELIEKNFSKNVALIDLLSPNGIYTETIGVLLEEQ